MTPQLKFTVYEQNVCPEGRIVKEPAGWKQSKIVFERDKKLYSVVKHFEGEFIWYAWARKLFNRIEIESGPDATVTLVVSIKFSILGEYEDLFNGVIDLTELEELTKKGKPYRIKAPILREDSWARFINALQTPINVLAEESLFGEPVNVEEKISLPLPSQLLFEQYKVKDLPVGSLSTVWSIPNFGSLIIDFIKEELNSFDEDEIFTYPVSIQDGFPLDLPKSEAKFAGVRTILASVDFYQGSLIAPTALDADLKAYVTYSTGARVNLYNVEWTRTDITLGGKTWTRFTLSANYDQSPTDAIILYLLNGSGVTQNVYMGMPAGAPPDLGTEQFISIEANTTYPDTVTDAMLLKDVATNLLRKITGRNDILADGGALDGYKGKYTLQKILHIRGASMEELPLDMSFEQFWNIVSPALGLGLGYNSGGQIVIDNISKFFKITPSVTFDKVGSITRTYGKDYFYKLIEYGFTDWSVESKGGLDDAQTPKRKSLRNKKSGRVLKIESSGFAAPMGTEQARRKRFSNERDFRADQKISIIAVKQVEDGYTPEVGTDFAEVTNITNPDTRINFRLLPSRCFKRMQPYLQGCLEYYNDEKFYDAGGEGNTTAKLKLFPTDPEYCAEDANGGLAEDDDISKGIENLILPNYYEVQKVPCTWNELKTIDANKDNAIGIPYDGINRSMYIDRLAFTLYGGYFDANLLETSPTAFDDYELYEDSEIFAFEDGALGLYEK